MKIKRIMALLGVIIFAGSIATAQNFKYIGAAKCKMCHNKPQKGEQYNVWKAGPHANAMKSLSATEAKDPKCLKCHSTAAVINPKLKGGIQATEGVSCEACHGPGSAYKAPAIMKNQRVALTKGLVIPDEALCKTCHNAESPTFKGFNYEEYLAQIAHDDPLTK